MRHILTILAAIALVALPVSPALAGHGHPTPDDPPVTVTVEWSMPTPEGGWAETPTAETATWPQILATGAECGGWSQVDTYTGPQTVIDAILADGLLTLVDGVPEDHAVVQSWEFVEQPVCDGESEPTTDPTAEPTAEPAPIPASASPAVAAALIPAYAG
jgi:hypothetical protein